MTRRHIAMVSIPAPGHVNPSLAIIARLVAAGHRVTYANDESMREIIEATGAEFAPYVSMLPSLVPSPDGAEPEKSWDGDLIDQLTIFQDDYESMLPQLRRIYEDDRPDLFLYDIAGLEPRVGRKKYPVLPAPHSSHLCAEFGKTELQELLAIIGEVAEEMANRKRWVVKLVGDRSVLPIALIEKLQAAESSTAGLKKPTVNLAIGYSGRAEIADAIKSILKSHQGISLDQLSEKLTPELITEHLYTGGQADPDLIIRTSGEQRLSGFMLWQSSNSELYFEEALWPDFRKVDFLRALRAFARRHRRFGA